jgi:hypothetical protein
MGQSYIDSMVFSEGGLILLLAWKLGQTGVGYLFRHCTGVFCPQGQLLNSKEQIPF